jgi:hypothetical protein
MATALKLGPKDHGQPLSYQEYLAAPYRVPRRPGPLYHRGGFLACQGNPALSRIPWQMAGRQEKDAEFPCFTAIGLSATCEKVAGRAGGLG